MSIHIHICYQADKAYSFDGWILPFNSVVNALAGDDDVSGVSPRNGFENAGMLYLGDGNDRLTGHSLKSDEWANCTIGLHSSGTGSRLYAGNGQDTIIGQGGYRGLLNQCLLDTGWGNDLINCSALKAVNYDQRSEGFANYGSVNTHVCDDNISVSGRGYGLNNLGDIVTEYNRDQILATADETCFDQAIFNQESGSIHTCSLDDVIRAFAR